MIYRVDGKIMWYLGVPGNYRERRGEGRVTGLAFKKILSKTHCLIYSCNVFKNTPRDFALNKIQLHSFYRNLTSPEFQTNVFPKMIGVPDNAWI